MNDPLAPALAQGLEALHLDLSLGAQQGLLAYLRMIERWSRVYNLTAVRDPQAMLTQHLMDCLAIVLPLRRHFSTSAPALTRQVLDVGSGAGLPGAVLALCEPHWEVTCVDAVAKKAGFIRQVAAELALPNLHAVHGRVEELGERRFDVVTSRAFASLADFISLTRACLAPKGVWVAMKAHLDASEQGDLPADIEMFHVEPLQVPGLAATRQLVWMRPLPPAIA